MNTTTAILILLVTGAVAVWGIWCALRHPKSSDQVLPSVSLAVIAFIVMLGIHAHDKRVAARAAIEQQQLAQGYLPVEHAQLSVNLNERCPPRTDGMTDQLVMLITTQADHQPEITGCLRIAQRPYLVKEKK